LVFHHGDFRIRRAFAQPPTSYPARHDGERLPEKTVTRKNRIIILVTATICGALTLTAVRARDVPRVITGFVSHTLCSAAFVSRVNPDQVYAETMNAMPGTGLIAWAVNYRIDREAKQVTATLLGGGQSRAVFHEGLGCYLSHGDEAVDASLPSAGSKTQRALLPEIAGPALVETANPDLKLALDRAFIEPDQPPFRHTKAVVVVKDGKVVAERYAPGYGIDTPILGYSATKSVISALTGILVREGKLAVNEPAPVAAWQHPHDPRHAITIDHAAPYQRTGDGQFAQCLARQRLRWRQPDEICRARHGGIRGKLGS
jgi:hypothetical protein